jgi:hypothetical protein
MRPRRVPDSPISASSSRMSRTSARIDRTQKRRRLAHGNGAGAEGLQRQAQRGQLVGMVKQPRRIGGRELDDLGDQQRLRGDAASPD